ncbi:MAG TPA: helix-turn-helix domain-containing protein [Phycisphaerae bacterium]|nr:helix-turn-helix domain-containing protein [Phycisphaerae bacterium]HRY67699.1 helix-turn-helix domain-containing protein [Phycisphaerae bacterium]
MIMQNYPVMFVLPGDPPQPCPELLTEKEAVRYLRLDDNKNPSRTLKYYRERGLLRGTPVGRHLLYRRVELDRFLELQTVGDTEECRRPPRR